MHFFDELKRRKVTRVAVVYLVAAWVVLEVTSVVAPALSLPSWTTTLVLYVLAIGFPVALVLAWMFDITPDGIKLGEGYGRRKDDHSKPLGAMVLLAAMSIGGVWYFTQVDEPLMFMNDDEIPSIAVLPFQNFSPDPNQEYFVDGLTEEILNYLAKTDNLRVIARTSSFAFRGQNIDMREIGAILGVNHLLEGSVRKAGNAIRVTAQLIRVSDNSHIWSETYDRTLENVFALQDELSAGIAGVINGYLLPDVAVEDQIRTVPLDLLTGTTTDNADAREAYLQGVYESRSNDEDNTRRAIEYLLRAVALDPEFASAWVALSNAYTTAGSFTFGYMPMDVARPLSTNAANRAIEINPGLSEGWLALATAQFQDGLHEEALISAEKAISLNPNAAGAHARRASLLRLRGRQADFIDAAERALLLDPLGPIARSMYAYSLIYRGQSDEAKAFLKSWSEDENIGTLAQNYYTLSALLAGDLMALHNLAEQLDAEGNAGESWVRHRITEAYMTLGMMDEAVRWSVPQSNFLLAYQSGDYARSFEMTRAFMALTRDERRDRGFMDLFVYHPFEILTAGLMGDMPGMQEELDGHVGDRMFEVTMTAPNFRYRPWGLQQSRHAWIYNQQGNSAAARGMAQQGIDKLNEIRATGFGRPDYDYEEARLYAQMGDIEAGLAALSRAIDGGFKSWEIAVDPLIGPLREDPRFAQIMARHDATVAAIRAEIEAGDG